MTNLSDESRSLIEPVAKRLTLSHKSISIRSIIEEIYGEEIPEIVEHEIIELSKSIQIKRQQLVKELYDHLWSNITRTKEERVRKLTKTHDSVTETTTTYKPTQLPAPVLLHLYQVALKTESGDIEINDMLEDSSIRPPEITHTERVLGDIERA